MPYKGKALKNARKAMKNPKTLPVLLVDPHKIMSPKPKKKKGKSKK